MVRVKDEDLKVDVLASGKLRHLVDTHGSGRPRLRAVGLGVERPGTSADVGLNTCRDVGPGIAEFGAGCRGVTVAAQIRPCGVGARGIEIERDMRFEMLEARRDGCRWRRQSGRGR